MRQVFIRWITLDAQNYIPEVWYAVAVLWIALVVFGLMSLRSQLISTKAKVSWAMVIFLVPFGGLFAYCCFCLSKVDYYMLESWLPRGTKEKPHS
jgi:hypothetical protein